MKRVFVCSPYRAVGGNSVQDNVDLAWRLCKAVLDSGNAPFASHLFYTQLLDDAVERERDLGINAGQRWLESCEEIWVYDALGISSGMHRDVGAAAKCGAKAIVMPPPFARVPARLGPRVA